MAIYKWEGDYFYGGKFKRGEIFIKTRIKEKGEGHKMIKSDENTKERDPEGNPVLYYFKKIKEEELDDKETPRNYPGYYYWVWHNGAFFKVLGETEKYVLVDIEECGYEQADALGIPRGDVACDYHKEQKVGKWWLHKSVIKMLDEFGKGRFMYISISDVFNTGVYEVVERNENKIRVQGRLLKEHDRIVERIKEKLFPWNDIKMNKDAEPEWWWEGEWIVFEATFDIERMRKIRREMDGVFDFYLYGEEEVPYRL